MKRFSAIVFTGIFFLLIQTIALAQGPADGLRTAIIEPYPLTVTFNKTTNLIFPYAIKSVDRGSRDVLTQKASGVENILLVKASKENFSETNLSVITADGKLYSFLLTYSKSPALLNISFLKDTAFENTSTSVLLQPQNDEAQMQATSQWVAKRKRMLYGIRQKAYDMRLQLSGIYIKNDVFYFHLEIRNKSNISYDLDMLRFFVKDEKKFTRTASQEIELQPLYAYGDTAVVREQSKNTIVVALPKFTIPEKKHLFIQLMEKAGGRHMSLHVHNRTLLRAKSANE